MTAASDTTGRRDIDRFVREVVGQSPYSGLFVVTTGFDAVGSVRASITRIGFSSSAPESLIASVRRYSRVVEIVLSAIGLIALTIAALGITNAMLAAVRERRREIGVLKAIGARDRDVRRVFLLEAGLLGVVGGALGTTLGYGFARLVALAVNNYLAEQGLAGVALGFPFAIVAAGIVGSGLLALVAGTVPAQRAARLPARRDGGLVTASRTRVLAVVAIGLLVAAGCTDGGQSAAPARRPEGKPLQYVALGGDDVAGARRRFVDAWPQQLFRTGLPLTATMVNLAGPPAGVTEIQRDQLQTALRLHPDITTITLVDDLEHGSRSRRWRGPSVRS